GSPLCGSFPSTSTVSAVSERARSALRAAAAFPCSPYERRDTAAIDYPWLRAAQRQHHKLATLEANLLPVRHWRCYHPKLHGSESPPRQSDRQLGRAENTLAARSDVSGSRKRL